MTYPVQDESAYVEWEFPPHECYFLDDNGVETGVMQDGKMVIYLIRRCNQCENSSFEATDREYKAPK